jgi:hypothetical protein
MNYSQYHNYDQMEECQVRDSLNSIFENVESVFETARIGLIMLESDDPSIVPTAIRNVLVFGRAVTNVLQKIKRLDPSFDDWYTPYKQEMRQDPLLKYLYKLRSEVLKEGIFPVSVAVGIDIFSTDWISHLPKPPNALGFFIGDGFGGSGWEIKTYDDKIEKFYVKMPWETVNVSIYFKNMPSTHLGEYIGDESIDEVCKLYLDYLRNMIDDAKKKFIQSNQRQIE